MIQHPDEIMTTEERAHQMWAVHPLDLDRLGFKTRIDFYHVHILAAIKQEQGKDNV